MKPEDIIVGRKYKHTDYPGCVWLGAGKRKPYTGVYGKPIEFTEKHLVLLHAIHLFGHGPKIGTDIIPEDNVNDGYFVFDWDKFRLVDEPQ